MNRLALAIGIALVGSTGVFTASQRGSAPAEIVGPAIAERDAPAQTGLASYYARVLHGRITAAGAPFDNEAMVAAHPTYPFGTVLRVTNLRNQRSVRVQIVDRGPAKGPRADGVIIDLSRAAAQALDFLRSGRTRVQLDVVSTPAGP